MQNKQHYKSEKKSPSINTSTWENTPNESQKVFETVANVSKRKSLVTRGKTPKLHATGKSLDASVATINKIISQYL